MEALQTAISLIMKSMVLGARWAGRRRMHYLRTGSGRQVRPSEVEAQMALLRAEVECLKSQVDILKTRLTEIGSRRPYSWSLRLKVLRYMEYFSVPRRRIRKHLGIPRGTLYRWLHRLEQGKLDKKTSEAEPSNRTPRELARLIWQIFSSNPQWGKRRIAMTIRALGVFIAASTVRNVLLRPRPRDKEPTTAILPAAQQIPAHNVPRQIVARYPHHVWSMDLTRVYRWGLWPTSVLVAIDHFSRKVTTARASLRGSGVWVSSAMRSAFEGCGVPRHIITDKESVFTCEEFENALSGWGVCHRFGAVGQHGSISVTERVVRTLKHEWLKRAPLIGGMDHLDTLLGGFETYYNEWRPHMTLGGAMPETAWAGRLWMMPDRSKKKLPPHIQEHHFPEVGITAYRLPKAGITGACPLQVVSRPLDYRSLSHTCLSATHGASGSRSRDDIAAEGNA